MSCQLSDSRTTSSATNCRHSISMASKTTKEIYFRITNADGELIDLTQPGYTLEAFAKTSVSGDSIAAFNQFNGLFTPIALPATPDATTVNALLGLSLSPELEDPLLSYYVDAFITNPQGSVFEHSSFVINIIYK